MDRTDHLNLREIARVLELDPVRAYRLGHHFHLAPGDPCVPREVVAQAQHETDGETRYRLILDWLLAHFQEHDLHGRSWAHTHR